MLQLQFDYMCAFWNPLMRSAHPNKNGLTADNYFLLAPSSGQYFYEVAKRNLSLVSFFFIIKRVYLTVLPDNPYAQV